MFSIYDSIMSFFLLYTCTFAISSMWLYCPGWMEQWRSGWMRWFSRSHLKYLAICQLCCAFWIALLIQPIFISFNTIIGYIMIAISAAGMSWLFGALTTMLLWIKALVERTMLEAMKNDEDN